MVFSILHRVHRLFLECVGAIAFYTVLPIPRCISPSFQNAARFAPLVGIMIGLMLWFTDGLLTYSNLPIFTRSSVLVIAWIIITGGLHLDGAMDTADGLAVMQPERRLEVMADSRTGAFGVMMAIAIVALKTAALTDLTEYRGWAMLLAAGWGRWGQQVAIAAYPYLKPTGKGAFHKAALPSLWHCLPSWVGLVSLHLGWMVTTPDIWLFNGSVMVTGMAIALAVGYWLHHTLGGHTGDTYGAVVELTETLLLLLVTLLATLMT